MAVLLVLTADVFSTIFVARGGAGVLTRRLYRLTWRVWGLVCRYLPRPRHRRFLALAGPVLFPATVALWVGELVVGFALIYLPFVDLLAISGPSTPDVGPDWAQALYFSGSAATTVGVGDVYATTWPLRLLAVAEAMAGFALFSVSISYLLNVYGGVSRTRALAWGIHRFARPRPEEEPADLIVRALETGTAGQLTSWFDGSASSLHQVMQDEAQYPLMEYFHSSEDDTALPVALPTLLETVTLVRALLDPSAYPGLVSGPSTLAAYETAVTYGLERAKRVGLSADDEAEARQERVAAYEGARRRLGQGGVALRHDAEARELYGRLRSEWDRANAGVRRHFGYAG